MLRLVSPRSRFQTPSAGRWVLQLVDKVLADRRDTVSNPISGEVGAAAMDNNGLTINVADVSNPISGEVGAAAEDLRYWPVWSVRGFQTPSAGRWVLQLCGLASPGYDNPRPFQTPSAGRWVLQPLAKVDAEKKAVKGFKPHQRGGGCCSGAHRGCPPCLRLHVSNPISGEVGAAASGQPFALRRRHKFQTPSAGRWVLQP